MVATPDLICLYSSVPQSGKTTLAKMLVNRLPVYVPTRFAAAMKSMIFSLLLSAGYTKYVANQFIEGARKEEPLEVFGGKTCRQLMQTIGTEWGRDNVTQNIWINVLNRKLDRLVGGAKKAIIDDLRFPNEYLAMRERGALIIRIHRSSSPDGNGHSSDHACDLEHFDHVIQNNGSKGELWSSFRKIINI